MSVTIPMWVIWLFCGCAAAGALLILGGVIALIAYGMWEARQIGRIFGW